MIDTKGSSFRIQYTIDNVIEYVLSVAVSDT